ncbi:MAG: hypothetical protein KAS75_04070, partial [Planctomycetes bacterium]|nr:hypothetical protein [Planctomycetota bacterium]
MSQSNTENVCTNAENHRNSLTWPEKLHTKSIIFHFVKRKSHSSKPRNRRISASDEFLHTTGDAVSQFLVRFGTRDIFDVMRAKKKPRKCITYKALTNEAEGTR